MLFWDLQSKLTLQHNKTDTWQSTWYLIVNLWLLYFSFSDQGWTVGRVWGHWEVREIIYLTFAKIGASENLSYRCMCMSIHINMNCLFCVCICIAALRHQGHVYLMEYWWYEPLLQLSYLYHALRSEYLKVDTILWNLKGNGGFLFCKVYKNHLYEFWTIIGAKGLPLNK